MKVLFFLLLSSVVASAQTMPVQKLLEAQTRCSSFVHLNEQYVFMGSSPTQLRLISRNDGSVINFNVGGFLIDAVIENTNLYALTSSGLEIWDLQTQTRQAQFATQQLGRRMENGERPTGFVISKGRAFVTHGRLGVMVVDLKTQKVVSQILLAQNQSPKESMATAVLAINETAYILMDNFTLSHDTPAFRGLIALNLDSHQVTAEMGELDPGADALATDGKKLFISYGGIPIWKLSMVGLGSSSQLPRVERRLGQLAGLEGHPTGIPSVDETNYYTCFSTTINGRYLVVPKTIDRKTTSLD